jgi:hypothetical protein
MKLIKGHQIKITQDMIKRVLTRKIFLNFLVKNFFSYFRNMRKSRLRLKLKEMKHVYKRQQRTKKDEGKINFVNVNVMNQFLLFYLLDNTTGQQNFS